jgi:2-isopropylmalate synthase
VQAKTDAEGGEVTSDQLWTVFQDEYLPAKDVSDKWGRFELTGSRTESDFAGTLKLSVDLRDGDQVSRQDAVGNGPIDAFLKLMAAHDIHVELFDYVEHTLSAGGDAYAAAYVELNVNGKRLWGVGIDSDISTASLKAVVSAVNRAVRQEQDQLVSA